MRTIINNIASIAMSMMIGMNASAIANNIEDNITVETIATAPITYKKEVTGSVEYQADGDTVIEYSDDSSILINRTDNVYIMWLPESEDLEYNYNTEEELMNAIEDYHGVVTDLTCPEGTTLNPYGYAEVEEELDKISGEILELLDSTGLEIFYGDMAIEDYEEARGYTDRMVLGYYHRTGNYIMMRESKYAISSALIHELGHALDNNLGLHYNETIIDSYMNQEVTFTNANNADYYYSNIYEYIAESIAEYYNDTLDKDTDIYQELDYILGE